MIKTEEKGSDVNLATFLLADAFRHDCELQLIITNDSDLREPIRLVKDELGVPIGIVNPHPPHRRSLALEATFFRPLRRKTLAQCQFPSALKDAHGTFSKPRAW